jgi:hypothetical protein
MRENQVFCLEPQVAVQQQVQVQLARTEPRSAAPSARRPFRLLELAAARSASWSWDNI